jgi:hypothetical protein
VEITGVFINETIDPKPYDESESNLSRMYLRKALEKRKLLHDGTDNAEYNINCFNLFIRFLHRELYVKKKLLTDPKQINGLFSQVVFFYPCKNVIKPMHIPFVLVGCFCGSLAEVLMF